MESSKNLVNAGPDRVFHFVLSSKRIHNNFFLINSPDWVPFHLANRGALLPFQLGKR
jgi:hypothetical protein